MTLSCPLCDAAGGDLLWQDDALRVVLVDEAAYPGFVRVIWRHHVAEMTDIPLVERNRLMRVVWCVEATQRSTLRPHKINLASFGNMVPHLHWHVIPRWSEDPCFPEAIWAAPRRAPGAAYLAPARAAVPALREALPRALDAVATSAR